jgi:hypothetical protein
MDQISVRARDCQKVGGSGGFDPLVVGDRVWYDERLWKVVGIYIAYDPVESQSLEYCVLASCGDVVREREGRP